MRTQERRPPAEAPSQAVGETSASVAQTADSPWWESPALAYALGMQDGAQLALEEIASVLLEVLGRGRQEHDRAEPVEVLIRHRNQLAARGQRGWVA